MFESDSPVNLYPGCWRSTFQPQFCRNRHSSALERVRVLRRKGRPLSIKKDLLVNLYPGWVILTEDQHFNLNFCRKLGESGSVREVESPGDVGLCWSALLVSAPPTYLRASWSQASNLQSKPLFICDHQHSSIDFPVKNCTSEKVKYGG